jgi:hypothetical protein
MTRRDTERRKHPRSRGGFKPSGGGPGLINHVENISCSGVLCRTHKPIVEMTKLSIVLNLPGGRAIKTEGIAIRCESLPPKHDEFKVAIIFPKLSEDDHRAIREYVEQDLAHDGAAAD